MVLGLGGIMLQITMSMKFRENPGGITNVWKISNRTYVFRIRFARLELILSSSPSGNRAFYTRRKNFG
jgi:hypothetical protein